MFGAAPSGMQGSPQADTQLLCLEMQKRMEELYPILQQASGEKVSTGASHSALQQAFVAYTYSFSTNPQILQQGNSGQFNPAFHVDFNKWAQAVQNNPDPSSCYPEPLVGLPALEARIGQQQRAVEECNNALDELRQKFGNLKDHQQVQSLQKLEECRQRHQKLSRQLLQVVTALEAFATHTGAARRSLPMEVQLEDRLARLEEAVHAPASARARLEELWVVLRGLLQRGPPSGVSACIADSEVQKTLRITAAQGDLLEQLQEELGRRKRDITQFENALARLSPSSSGLASLPPSARPL